ncbi:ABC transporter ATP-binding protein [Paenibacillus radicis (ex Gao et al. 2016)]|uniref:ABC transporter ATP-binding protein n=1 Tax=Paenibacillus radicis (ex Gao et al. 2016) TaxID=1737354 RepID=A0A917M528_9BACL|nr:ABC transporter ATP-binding protein [Paenibacillus radicis (ex Gao et al. 2016)]GGG79284.1 ABC transporter ATP-binding protein [Paenibacillus radicis (ex Gao et al. 2016)]
MSKREKLAEDPQGDALSVQGLHYGFSGEEPLFHDLSFTVKKGEFVSIVATSGMGKTTLFRLLAGLLVPGSGVIAVNGSATAKQNAVGYMPQRDCLMPWRTVQDNAAIGLELQGSSKREARRRVLELLPELGLEGTELKYPHELSGGMRQRVSFLRSLLGGGDLLLLDEPFSALDAMTRTGMQQWLLQVWEKHKKTILFITHDIDEALLLSDRVLVAARRPITELQSVEIELPRPRTYETVLDTRFVALKRALMEQFGRLNHAADAGRESLESIRPASSRSTRVQGGASG